MAKLWEGRQASEINAAAEDFNASIRVDSKMVQQDIRGSMAHAAMLGRQGIISAQDADTIIAGLEGILNDLVSGALSVDMTCEDVHTFVEMELTARVGEAGKRLHTARSRNDQVAVDVRLYLRSCAEKIDSLLRDTILALMDKAEEYSQAVMPGYTHLQRAQPISFGHHLLAYAWMLTRDRSRLSDAVRRMNLSPLGAGALAGTTYDIDREFTARELGFDGVCMNSIDAVSDRDFAVELSSAMALVMLHLSRLSEELILWSSWEFKFITLHDDFTTGSSIMPQKKNPDMAELIRGKTGRVYGNLITLLTLMKGLPLAYNKDMQEDKEAVFDSVETVSACLEILAPMLRSMTVNTQRLRQAASEGFINATDLADYLVRKDVPFRTAYKLVGQIVAGCVKQGLTLETLPLESYQAESPLFEEDLFEAINLETCMRKRTSQGGAAPDSVAEQLALLRKLV